VKEAKKGSSSFLKKRNKKLLSILSLAALKKERDFAPHVGSPFL
jgi:hypothetical protein